MFIEIRHLHEVCSIIVDTTNMVLVGRLKNITSTDLGIYRNLTLEQTLTDDVMSPISLGNFEKVMTDLVPG